MSHLVIYIIGVVLGFTLGVVVIGTQTAEMRESKASCEKTLPRNIECAWAIPEEAGK